MTSLLVSAFSLQMLPVKEPPATSADLQSFHFQVDTVLPHDVKGMLVSSALRSAIGHEATAKFLSQLFGVEVEFNRTQVTFPHHDIDSLVVAQIAPGRLPVGRELSEEELATIPVIFFEISRI